MSPKLPQVSGERLIGFLENLGYQVVRQRGSHVMMKKSTEAGSHTITVPRHKTVAKGTLNDILSKVAIWNSTSKESLVNRL